MLIGRKDKKNLRGQTQLVAAGLAREDGDERGCTVGAFEERLGEVGEVVRGDAAAEVEAAATVARHVAAHTEKRQKMKRCPLSMWVETHGGVACGGKQWAREKKHEKG